MNNAEKYKQQISNLLDADLLFALRDNKIVSCFKIDCSSCDFNKINADCNLQMVRWLMAEASEITQ